MRAVKRRPRSRRPPRLCRELRYGVAAWPTGTRAAPDQTAAPDRPCPQRCMVGSNFPVERMAGDFSALEELVLAFLRICPPNNVLTS